MSLKANIIELAGKGVLVTHLLHMQLIVQEPCTLESLYKKNFTLTI